MEYPEILEMPNVPALEIVTVLIFAGRDIVLDRHVHPGVNHQLPKRQGRNTCRDVRFQNACVFLCVFFYTRKIPLFYSHSYLRPQMEVLCFFLNPQDYLTQQLYPTLVPSPRNSTKTRWYSLSCCSYSHPESSSDIFQ